MTDISESGIEAALDEAALWDEGFTSHPREYQVLRMDGDDIQTVSRHPDRGAMEDALKAARMRAAIQAYLPFHPPASREERLRVKALEWSDPFMDADLRGGLYTEAQSLLGTYKVWGDGSWSLGMHFVTGHSDLDDGKSAAQEHYTNAVLSAIETESKKPECKLTRWDLEPTQVMKGLMVIEATESADGRWVTYEEAATLITSLREALDGVLAEADRDTQAFRRAREALREQS